MCFKVHCFSLQNEEAPVSRICYASMKHVEGDVVSPRDCILLASGNRKKDLPFVAKVTALWESPDDGKASKKVTKILLSILNLRLKVKCV